LLLGALLGSGAAFAGDEMLTEQNPEQIPETYALQEGDVIYLVPMEEVTEYQKKKRPLAGPFFCVGA
jgi:hypothetical protein